MHMIPLLSMLLNLALMCFAFKGRFSVCLILNTNGQRVWIDTSPWRTYKGPIDIEKMLNITSHQGDAMRYHLTPVRMAIINKSTNKCWQECGKKGTLVHYWWECRLLQPLWKIVWNFLRKLKMELPLDPVIPLMRLYPKKPETPIQNNLCTPMFIAGLFTIAKIWKHPKCPLVDEWIKSLWYIYTMEYYAAKRKKEFLLLQ